MYSMDEGYTSTLSIAPEGKFPVRRGNASDPEAFTKAWSKLPVGVDRKAALSDLYSPDVINNIVAGLEPPTTYANIEKAIDALSSNDMFGFVAATKTDENFMSQVLELSLIHI